MAVQINRDPTAFYSVVGAPYIHKRRTETHFPRPLEIGVAAGGIFFCVAVFGFSLVSADVMAKIVEVVHHVVK